MKNQVRKWSVAFGLLIMLTSLMPSKSINEIEFRSLTLSEAKVLAEKSGKMIFIDCYTVWCGPCKWMAANSFQNEEVAALYNSNFINMKVEMEKDADGKELAMKYEVRAYPTLLIIDSKGNLIRKEIGAKDANAMITFAKAALAK